MDENTKQIVEPRVSIVFTSYNHRVYLQQALDSLLNQTFKDFELIIVDDCSTDGSQEILKAYEDPRIRLFLNEKNSGSYVISSNFGASMARAPYIIFAQCDDWAEPQQLERLMFEMESHDVGVVFSCSNMVDENGLFLGNDFDGREKEFKKLHNFNSIIMREEATSYLMNSCIIPNLSAALIKKELYDDLQGLSTTYLVLADWDFWLRMTQIADFYYIREPLNNFRQHSTTIRSSIKTKRQVREIFKMVFSFAEQTGLSSKKACHIAANLWIRWATTGKKEWLKAFPSLFKEGCKHSYYFSIATIIEFFILLVRPISVNK